MVSRGLLVAAFLLVSAVARAGDIVVLKDGTVLEGNVGEMIPNQSITITVEGQPRKIDWKDVDRVNIDRQKAAPPAPPTERAMTFVHVDGPPDAIVQALDPRGTMAWTEVCKGACDRELPADGLYRIDAPGIRTSRAFKIEGPRSDLGVKTASSAGFVGGLTLLIVGGVALVNGIGFLLISQEPTWSTQTMNDFIEAGLVLGGVGLASMIAGGILLGTNLRTNVSGETTLRVPAWRDTPRLLPSSRFPALSFPAISGSF